MSSWPVLVFDIESIPDVAGLRSLRQMDASVDDAAVYDAEIADRAARGKGDFMPLYLQRVLVIFNLIERHEPQLVSWNGSGFDLPVLHYRGMRHGVVASKYWDLGDDDREYRYNNYISRYHLRHLDLMDLLAMYQSRANAPLDAMAKLCGFPGKLGMDGSQVYGAYLDGRRDEIRRYCETDAMNTYLLWCRFEKMRGHLDEAGYRREIGIARDAVAAIGEPHWLEYLSAWPAEGARTAEGSSSALSEAAAAAPLAGEEPLPAVEAAPAVIVETTTETKTTETTIYIDSSSIRA